MRKFWQAFFEFFSDGSCWGIQHPVGENSARWNVATRYRCAPKVTILLLFRVGNMALKSKVAAYLLPGVACLTSWGGSRYFFSRTALNVPSFDGPSPTSGENSASPVIKSAVSNFPLHVNVPASRPTLPRRNSTGPENVTEFSSPRVHFASEGLAPAQTLDCGSVTVKSAFSVALCIKAQGTVLLASKSNLDVPTASHVRRLCLGQDEGECVHDHCQNYCARCFHVFF